MVSRDVNWWDNCPIPTNIWRVKGRRDASCLIRLATGFANVLSNNPANLVTLMLEQESNHVNHAFSQTQNKRKKNLRQSMRHCCKRRNATSGGSSMCSKGDDDNQAAASTSSLSPVHHRAARKCFVWFLFLPSLFQSWITSVLYCPLSFFSSSQNCLPDAAAIMDECSSGSFASRTGCILTYSGSSVDIVINYLIFAIDLQACSLVVISSSHPKLRLLPLLSLIFAILFQIVLCLILACSGISIVWCAMCGWMLLEQRKRLHPEQPASTNVRTSFALSLGVVILMNFGVMIYYAIVAPAITTVAHVAAILLGLLLSFLGGVVAESRIRTISGASPTTAIDMQTPPHQEQKQHDS